ncbi:hypothetical protein [Pseudomonas sp. MYb185]|uniref:hypothetical protein n=1 Tax=Pseudomonas sp. MYb185 TaxID=1848729 RepID=UPI000CFAB45D|nr:hypothetical protein [Pseudomonas sp. MYb185]PRB81910.1 hypothetical protein CQ007_06915 [Pseudomonas sp. MYb185]
MSGKICILDRGPACEPDKFIVEIVGKQHPETQKLVICDGAGAPLTTVTAAAVEEEVNGEAFSSLLKVWDWAEMSGESLALEIASEAGGPIRLPLTRGLRSTPRQEDAQLNQIVPVIPCSALPGIRCSSDLGVPVLVRSGYIYVFYHQKLWRELEVRFTDAGTRFHDIDVAGYREGKGFVPGKREASGVALEDIWLPAQWNGRRAVPVQLMFSEVQLSAARLAYLESHELRLEPRTRSPDLLISEAGFMKRWAGSPDGSAMLHAFTGDGTNASASASLARHGMELFAFPLSLCAPQRQRQPGHEWLLDQPARLICDLTGNYPQQALARTRETVNTWRKGESLEPSDQFESEAWSACQDGCSAETTAIWAAQEVQDDALQSARQRQLHAILLPDPMHRMRHLASRIDNLQELLKDCTRLAMEHPHHASALLLHNLAVPSRIGGNLNPLSRSLRSKLNDDGKREINIATAAMERAHVGKLLENAQQALAEALKTAQYQQCIADHLSLDGFDYQAAMFFAVRLLACIATPAAQLGPLAFSGEIHDAVTGLSLHRSGRNPAQQLLQSIANNDRHPLHVMLWPAIRDDQLFTTYQAPGEEPNQGDGGFRATILASLEDKDAPDQETQTLDGITLAALMASGALQDSFTLQLGARQGMMVLSRINEILNGAVQAAENRMIDLANQVVDSRQTQARQQATIDNARQSQILHRSALGAQARTVNIRLHGMQAEHLRQTMPRAFEGAVFVRAGNLGQASIRDYYLFGLEDLPEVDPGAAAARMYGQYLDGSGRPLGTTNARSARRTGMPVVPESGVYFAVPRNSRTAEALSQLNQAIHQETLAGSALVASQGRASHLGTSLQLATDNLRRARDGLAHRTLNSRPFSAMVLMMEVWNVRVAMEEYAQNGLERSGFRQKIGVLSAFVDLLIAIEALTGKTAGSQSIYRVASRPLLTFSQQRLESIFGIRLAAHITKEVTGRLLSQVAAGLLLAGLSLSDAIHADRWSDSAIWGHYMMAVGGLLGVGAVLMSGSVLFGLVGIVAVALLIGGATVVALFSNTDFEDWLAGSIFGEEGTLSSTMRSVADMLPFLGSTPRYLEEPDQAFYRLVGLLTGIRIQIENNPDHDPRARIDGDSSPEGLMRRANTRITVTSNILGLAAQLGRPDKIVRCCLARREISITPTPQGSSHQSSLRLVPSQSTPLLTHVTKDAVALYVNTPANTHQNGRGYQLIDEYHWEVRAQLRLEDKLQDTVWAFPAPGPKVAPVDPAQYAEPNFRKTKQLLWADQETHGTLGAEV